MSLTAGRSSWVRDEKLEKLQIFPAASAPTDSLGGQAASKTLTKKVEPQMLLHPSQCQDGGFYSYLRVFCITLNG